jgi:hypothetical protein
LWKGEAAAVTTSDVQTGRYRPFVKALIETLYAPRSRLSRPARKSMNARLGRQDGRLASYARQLNDEALMAHCQRIQARAIRRAGEVLDEIEPAANQHDARARDGAGPSSRSEAATAAGLSPHQRRTALRVAAVPPDQFEKLVDSEHPPTITKLAELGTGTKPQAPTIEQSDHLNGRDPADFQIATRLSGGVAGCP